MGGGNASFQPFGTVEIAPAFQIDGQGLNIDSIDFWGAPDSSNTLMFVTAKGNSRVEVWQFPFVDNERSPIIHPTFGTSHVNGVVVDQQSNLLYISVGKPASTVSVFSIPDLKFVINFNKGGANFHGEPNLTLLKLRNGDKRIYVSADDIVFIHDAVTGAFLNEFTPTKGLETMAADDFTSVSTFLMRTAIPAFTFTTLTAHRMRRMAATSLAATTFFSRTRKASLFTAVPSMARTAGVA